MEVDPVSDPPLELQDPIPSTSVAADHAYCIPSPTKLKRKLQDTLDHAENCRKRLKTEQQRSTRLRKKAETLQAVIKDIEDQNLISPACAEVLEKTFSGVSLGILQRILKKGQGKAGHEYDVELRSFALTLNYYSSKAYNYVRETFDLCLPHPSTIRSWYTGVDGQPGFNKQAFESLRYT